MSKKFITQKIDITGWKKVVKELQKIKGGTYKEILDAECAEILGQTANRKSTKVADKSKIVGRHRPVNTFFLGYSGKKEAYTMKQGQAGVTKQTTYYLHHKLPNAVWSYIDARTKKHTQEKFGNWGLNKGQFYLMSKLINLPKPKKGFPKEVERFLSLRRNRIAGNVFAHTRGKNDKKYTIEVESRLSKVISYAGGAKNFKSVMKGRVRKFEQALAKGVLQDIKKRTRAYPLIFG